MRVLYFVRYANALSESYIRAESEYAESRGIRTFFCAKQEPIDGYKIDPSRVVLGHDLEKAVDLFKPDIIHVHWLTEAIAHSERLGRLNLPVTVRGHSFDVTKENVQAVCDLPFVRRVWIFPHFEERFGHPKAKPLPVAFNSRFFRKTTVYNDRRTVVRAGAGLSGKGIEEFIETARLCPDFDFVLAMTTASGEPGFASKIKDVPGNLRVMRGLQHEEVSRLMQNGAIYMRGYDPGGHAWGMPISVAEAMACGMLTLVPDLPEARDYTMDCGRTFDGPGHAAEIIRWAAAKNESFWIKAVSNAVEASEFYKPSEVLPPLISYWESILMNEG